MKKNTSKVGNELRKLASNISSGKIQIEGNLSFRELSKTATINRLQILMGVIKN